MGSADEKREPPEERGEGREREKDGYECMRKRGDERESLDFGHKEANGL